MLPVKTSHKYDKALKKECNTENSNKINEINEYNFHFQVKKKLYEPLLKHI